MITPTYYACRVYTYVYRYQRMSITRYAYEFIHNIAYIFTIIEKAPLYLDTVFPKPFFSGIV